MSSGSGSGHPVSWLLIERGLPGNRYLPAEQVAEIVAERVILSFDRAELEPLEFEHSPEQVRLGSHADPPGGVVEWLRRLLRGGRQPSLAQALPPGRVRGNPSWERLHLPPAALHSLA